MPCETCMNAPCPKIQATKRLLGNWARERRRQGVSIVGPPKDKKAMDDAMAQPVDDVLSAECDCGCHQ